jgi:hypothetical protein
MSNQILPGIFGAKPLPVIVITVPTGPWLGVKVNTWAKAGVPITKLKLNTITRATTTRHIKLNLLFIDLYLSSLMNLILSS